MPAFALSVIERGVISCPSNKICPLCGVIIPAIIFANVDFPPPFGPVITTNLLSSITSKIITILLGKCNLFYNEE